MQGRIGNQREITAARLQLWILPLHGAMQAEEKASKIIGITHPSAAFRQPSLHDGHDISTCNAACLCKDSTIKSGACFDCKRSICSNIWKKGSAFQSSRATALFSLSWCCDELVSFWECALNSIMLMLPDGPSARSVKYGVFLFCRAISTRWNIDLSTCAHIFNTTWFRRSTATMTEEISCSGNWHAHWNVESSAGGAQWPTGFYHLWVKSWLRPMTLTLTVRGNKKLCSHFKSARVSAHTQDMLQWSEKLQDTTPSNFAITGPDCCRL